MSRAAQAPAPDWLPPYSAAQQKLLEPGDTPVSVPARRVFPDLARFGYANNRPMRDPQESLKFTRLVATVLTDSPRLYDIVEVDPKLANEIAQYGPPPPQEADPWYVAQYDDSGIATLVQAPLSEQARTAYERGEAARQAGDITGAIAAFREAIDQSPDVPGLHMALADAFLSQGNPGEAELVYEQVIEIDPTYASAHRALASLLLNRGEVERAHDALAEALAYHPGSAAARQLAEEMVGDLHEGARPKPFPIFLDVDLAGAVRVGSAPTGPAQMYAGCRAVMRYEPQLRAVIFDQPETTPYYLSVAEEVVCLESAIGAYLFDLAEAAEDGSKSSPVDTNLEDLMQLAQAEGLSGYVMFEILGQHRPERARTAPEDVHAAVVRYIENRVLGGAPDLPPGHYTASL